MPHPIQSGPGNRRIGADHGGPFRGDIPRNGLYDLRVRLGMTQADVGAAAGMTHHAARFWEVGRSKPRPTAMPAIAARLGISCDTLAALLAPPEGG